MPLTTPLSLLLTALLLAGTAPAAEPDTAATPAEEAFSLDDLDEDAPAAPAEEEFSLDDLDEEKPAAAPVHPHAARLNGPGGFNVSLAVDWTTELFLGDKKEFTFSTNHEYVMVSVTKGPFVRFTAEVTDMTFWEFVCRLPGGHQAKIGRIPVPFGPLFIHQIMGGIVEKPAPGGNHWVVMVPQAWVEYGIEYDHSFYNGDNYALLGKFWLTNGLTGSVDPADRTVDFTQPTRKRDNNLDKGAGVRLQNTLFGRYDANLSFYTCKWADDRLNDDGSLAEAFYEGDRLLMGNVDAQAGYGFIPLPVLRNLSLMSEFALIRTRSTLRSATQDLRVPWHTKHALLLQSRYRLPGRLGELQFRYGTYDDNTAVTNARDLINYNLAWKFRIMDGVTVIPMYMWNREAVNEFNDDFFFIKFFLEL